LLKPYIISDIECNSGELLDNECASTQHWYLTDLQVTLKKWRMMASVTC